MIHSELTNRALAATSLPMQGTRTGKRWLLMGGALALSACVSVNAPDKPIVIELNINIKQEVIYKLAADAGNTIQENSDIF
jgi:YnbE-like lipoprotein